ncbi:UNVERIFIED_CONTAM: hypothetical protein GTU68_041074 [Idotea baltica]|nr:hypothetical protein [Idotea baltica]
MGTATLSKSKELTEKGAQKAIAKQRAYFASGETKSITFRINQLKKLRSAIEKNEQQLIDALKLDLNKPAFEAYGTEIGFVLNEIKKTIKQLKGWAKPRRVPTSLFHYKATSKIHSDPYGVCLIIAPWNYPMQLLFSPLIGSIAAGNCTILKPSELSAHTSNIAAQIIEETFDADYIRIFEGAVETSKSLLANKFDFIFFTGSTNVGKVVYQAAARHLTPVLLELGGKSPCIVDENTHIEHTASRIMWGKLINAGQTCIAPDYLLVHKNIKSRLLAKMKQKIESFYGSNPLESDDYCRIISDRHYKRLVEMVDPEKIYCGGNSEVDSRYIEPTILDNVDPDDAIMQSEIFGPILPVMTYEHIDDAIQFVNDRPKPLALYVFTKNDKLAQKVLNNTSSGGACINETLMHLSNDHMPFGGVGESGIGGYHGQSSFDAFSHQKSVMDKSFLIDAPLRYAPYDKLSLNALKKLYDKLL